MRSKQVPRDNCAFPISPHSKASGVSWFGTQGVGGGERICLSGSEGRARDVRCDAHVGVAGHLLCRRFDATISVRLSSWFSERVASGDSCDSKLHARERGFRLSDGLWRLVSLQRRRTRNDTRTYVLNPPTHPQPPPRRRSQRPRLSAARRLYFSAHADRALLGCLHYRHGGRRR